MGHRKDWFNETVRSKVWPLLDQYLDGTSMFAVGWTGDRQLAAVIPREVEETEKLLHILGFKRNHWAALKRRSGGEWSDGSWVWRDHPNPLLPDWLAPMQLHVTVYDGEKLGGSSLPYSGSYSWCYAHWEDNYWRRPSDHVHGERFSAEEGVERFRRMLDDHGVSYYSEV